VPVREVDLPRGRDVVLRVDLVGAGLVRVGEVQEAAPVLGAQLLVGAERRVVGDGSEARADPVLEEAVRRRVDLELEVAVDVAVGDSLGEEIVELVSVGEAHDALDLPPAIESKRRRVDDAEEAVATTDEPEEVGVLVAGAAARDAVRTDDDEALEVGHERCVGEAAAVDIRRDGAADAQVVGARLLLADRPGSLRERFDEVRPLDAGLDFDEAVLVVDREDAGERMRVEDDTARAELLPAHRVPAAGDGDRPTRGAGEIECRADRLERVDRHDGVDFGRVELRVDVVDDRHRTLKSKGTKVKKASQAPVRAAAITTMSAISRARRARSGLLSALAEASPTAICELRFVMPRR
jgi:hypothetical protein